MRHVIPVVATLLFCAFIAAQQPDAHPAPILVPADSQIVVQLQGWPTMQRLHAKDPMGRAMRSEALRTFFADIEGILPKVVESLVEDLPFELSKDAMAELPAQIAAFDGRVILGVYLGQRVQGAVAVKDPNQAGAILSISPSPGHKKGDLESLRAWSAARLDELPGVAWKTIEAGELSVEAAVVSPEEGLELTKPFWLHGQLCIAGAKDLRRWLARVQATATSAEEQRRHEELRRSSLFAFIDPTAFAGFGMSSMRQMEESAEVLDEWASMWKSLGLICVTGVQFRTYSEHGHQYADLTVRWPGGPRGLLASAAPSRPGRASLQRYVPFRLQTANLYHLDLARLYREAMAVLDDLPGAVIDSSDLAESFEEKTGLRLLEDLLAHTSGELMTLDHQVAVEQDLWEAEDAGTQFRDRFEHKCVVVSLRDHAEFAKNLERTIRKFALHVSRKRTKYREQKIYTINHPFLPVRIHYSVCEPCVLLGVGKGGMEAIHAVIDEVLDAAAGKPVRLPKGVAARLELERDGLYAFGHQNTREIGVFIREFVEVYFDMMKNNFGEEIFEESVTVKSFNELFQSVGRLASELSSSRDGFILNVTRYRRDGMTLREIW